MKLLIIIAITLTTLLPQAPDSVITGIVKARAKIYSRPNKKSPVLHKLKRGTEVIILSEQNSKFFQVWYKGETGWLRFRHLENYKVVSDSVGQYALKTSRADLSALVAEIEPNKSTLVEPDPPAPIAVSKSTKTTSKPKTVPNRSTKSLSSIPMPVRQDTLVGKSINNSTTAVPYLVFSVLLNALFVALFVRYFMFYKRISKKYAPVIDIDAEVVKIKKERDKLSILFQSLDSDYKTKDDELNAEYKRKRSIYDHLLHEISIVEEDLEYISFGVYKPRYDFEDAARYQTAINRIRSDQKLMIKNKTAIKCNVEWSVGGSKREGTKMINRLMKLMMRAFNNECDSASLKVKWNNFDQMSARLNKAFEAINKLGEVNSTLIQRRYLNLKIEELSLVHEYREKVQEEKEEQRRIREQIREEEKVQKEIDKALKEADIEEKRYEKALSEVRKELDSAKGEELSKLNKSIESLQAQLLEATSNKERALSRAQQTKSGHVYVISNIGSFGENVYKIGMTRRLEPLDRVKELGDASVPFRFDIHAMIFSDDAPALEHQLHQAFDAKRLNLMNSRKEFFNVELAEIESIVVSNHGEIEFTQLAEAREYRETEALRIAESERVSSTEKLVEEFPESL